MKFSSVTIDDHLLDDSGSINGNNPTITQDDLDKMYMNEGNEDSYTTQVSSIAYHVSTWGEMTVIFSQTVYMITSLTAKELLNQLLIILGILLQQ